MNASRDLFHTSSVKVLTDLLARLEAAEGADRELDFWLTVLVSDPDPTDDLDKIRADIALVSIEEMAVDAPFTASLDASLALVERVLPTIPRSEPYGPWEWRVHGPNRNDAGLCRSVLTWPQTTAGAHVYMVGPAYGHTPALALLCALVKALIAKAVKP